MLHPPASDSMYSCPWLRFIFFWFGQFQEIIHAKLCMCSHIKQGQVHPCHLSSHSPSSRCLLRDKPLIVPWKNPDGSLVLLPWEYTPGRWPSMNQDTGLVYQVTNTQVLWLWPSPSPELRGQISTVYGALCHFRVSALRWLYSILSWPQRLH